MIKVSKFLKVYKTKHHRLGEIIELYPPIACDDSSAYFIDEQSFDQRNPDGTLTITTAEKDSSSLGHSSREVSEVQMALPVERTSAVLKARDFLFYLVESELDS